MLKTNLFERAAHRLGLTPSRSASPSAEAPDLEQGVVDTVTQAAPAAKTWGQWAKSAVPSPKAPAAETGSQTRWSPWSKTQPSKPNHASEMELMELGKVYEPEASVTPRAPAESPAGKDPVAWVPVDFC